MSRRVYKRPFKPGRLSPIFEMPRGFSLTPAPSGLLSPIVEESKPVSPDKWADATSDSDEDINAFIEKCRIKIRMREDNEKTNMHFEFPVRECNRYEFSRTHFYWTNSTEAEFSRASLNWMNLTEALADFTYDNRNYYLKEVKDFDPNPRDSDDFIQTVASALYKSLPDGFVV